MHLWSTAKQLQIEVNQTLFALRRIVVFYITSQALEVAPGIPVVLP